MNDKLICKIPECDNPGHARGWCKKHWQRWRKNGDPEKLLHFPTPEQSFEARTDRNGDGGCWLWTGSKIQGGYGKLWVYGKYMLAHRYSWQLHNGPIPDELCVLHRCDNPSCVNPDHLFLGTQADNLADMRAKGRDNQPKGEAHGMAKLTEPEIPLIRNDPRLHRIIAADYGVSSTLISVIKRCERWAHI